MKIKALLIATTLSSIPFVHTNTAIAGGIPVIDTASIAKYIEQIATMKEQIENQVKQITELKNQVAAMTGSRNLANLARETVDQAIPDSWKDIYNMKNVDINSLKTGKGFDPDANVNALNSMVSQVDTLMQNTLKRQETIKRLMAEVDHTQDIKASADLQNRISAEQASLANNQMQVDQLYKAYELQKEVRDQKATAYQTCMAWKEVDNRSCE